MRNPSKLSTYVAGVGTLALLLTTSAFAESRHHDGTSHTDRSATAPSRENRGGQRANGDRSFQHNQSPTPQRSYTPQSRGSERSFNGGSGWNRGNERNTSRDNNAYRDSQRNDNRSFQRNDNRSFQRNDNRSFQRNDRSFDRREPGRNFGSREEFRNGIPRSDGRVSMLGRVSRFEHERGGYRVWVGGSAYPYWVPESYFFGRHLGIGLDLRFGGIFRNGAVYVDALGWPGDPYYTDPYYNAGAYEGTYSVGTYADANENSLLRGVVDGVDYRAGLLYVRDNSGGRVITVDMRRVDQRYSHVDFTNLRPGDRVAITGAWVSDGQFAAAGIDGY